MEVNAESIEEAHKIAEDSCGSQWSEDCAGKWIIEEDLTEEIGLVVK